LPTIATDRLDIRPARAEDFALIHDRVLGDQAVMQYVFKGQRMDERGARSFFASGFAHDEKLLGYCIVVAREAGEVIGMAGLNPCDVLGEAGDHEFGIVIGRQWWRQGFAAEIGRALRDHALARWTRVLALAHPDNVASQLMITEGLGMRLQTTVAAYRDRGPRHVYVAKRA